MRSNLVRTPALAALALAAVALVLLPGCRQKRGKTGDRGQNDFVVTAEPTETELEYADPLPGLVITVQEVEGGFEDRFSPGDEISVTFTITKNDGDVLPIDELDGFEAHVSGPTYNYQRVLAVRSDVIDRSIGHEDDSYTFTFDALPDEYLDPPNYTGANPTDVLAGTSLLSGTYSIVLVAWKNYTSGVRSVRDVGTAVEDFRVGDVSMLEPREVVTSANCDQCHDRIQYHDEGLEGGGKHRGVRTCVTCHVAGAEDWWDPDDPAGDPTPGATIEFKVMIHRIHNSEHLPSALGIRTDPSDGSRDYMAEPEAYELVDGDFGIHEYEVAYPVWPNLNYGLPRDYGYTVSEDSGTTSPQYWDAGTSTFKSLTALNGATQLANENATRGGVTDCSKCHGDPDGAGPLAAPAQGLLAAVQPTRRACGSCHDDVDWGGNYRSNLKTMPAQPTDSECIVCHVNGSDPKLDVEAAHLHPMEQAAFMPAGRQGLNVNITSIEPDGSPLNTHLEPGEKLEITFSVKDDSGADVSVAMPGSGWTPSPNPWPYPWPAEQTGWWSSFSLVISGPTNNQNILNYVTVPTNHPAFNGGTASGSYTMNVPAVALFERLGVATAGVDAFTTLLDNHLNLRYPSPPATANTGAAPTILHSRAAAPVAAGTLAAPAAVWQSWVDVTNAAVGPGTWAKGDFICLGDGTPSEEYLRVQYVQSDVGGTLNDRLWFTSMYQTNSVTAAPGSTGPYGPWLRFAHPILDAANEVAVATLTPATWGDGVTAATVGGPSVSTVTEMGAGWTTGATILCSYTGDWECPSTYPLAYNSSPDITETLGKWEGKRLAPGTYTIGFWTRFPWAYVDADFPAFTPPAGYTGPDVEINSYPLVSPPCDATFLVNNPALNGAPWFVPAPASIVPYAIIPGGGTETCNQCHNDMWFHGGSRRGFGTCIMCHGLSGAEDWPQYRSTAVLPPTPGVTINFRDMLHKVHRGEDLTYASTYTVLGNSGSAHTYGVVVFPAMPDRTRHCAKCHGPTGTWEVPLDRDHPTDQVVPVREYKAACFSCHDSLADGAHMDLQVAPGGDEMCSLCHDIGDPFGIGVIHEPK